MGNIGQEHRLIWLWLHWIHCPGADICSGFQNVGDANIKLRKCSYCLWACALTHRIQQLLNCSHQVHGEMHNMLMSHDAMSLIKSKKDVTDITQEPLMQGESPCRAKPAHPACPHIHMSFRPSLCLVGGWSIWRWFAGNAKESIAWAPVWFFRLKSGFASNQHGGEVGHCGRLIVHWSFSSDYSFLSETMTWVSAWFLSEPI